MKVLGLDPSTKTGWAVLSYDPKCLRLDGFGEVHFPSDKGIQRVALIGKAVEALIYKWEPDLVMIEGYAFGNRHTLVTLVEIGTAIRLKVFGTGTPFASVTPNSLKKFVTGKGNSKKDVMMLSCYKQWGFEGTDNECDAYGLAALGMYSAHSDIEPRLGVGQRKLMQDWKAERLALFS